MKNDSLRIGVSFGITSAIITTLGLMVGLNSSTGSKMIVLGGILTIAIADAFSDALGIHMSEESEGKHSSKEIWQSTIFTFLAKLIFALTFIIPVLLFEISIAVIVSIIWGLLVLGIFSFKIAKSQNENPFKAVLEHLVIAVLVIIVANYIGGWLSENFR